MVVRFITRRFIGEYDPNLEKIYSFNTIMDNETVLFEILDAKSGQLNVSILQINTMLKLYRAIIIFFFLKIHVKNILSYNILDALCVSQFI